MSTAKTAAPLAAPALTSGSSSATAPVERTTAAAAPSAKRLFEPTPDPSKVPLHERIIADSASFSVNPKIVETFDKLSYGPAPEAQDAVDAW
jgi:hypothetical protein